MFSLLDYPSIVMPIKDLKIDAVKDVKDMGYNARDGNPFDKENWEICKLFSLSFIELKICWGTDAVRIDDPELWKNQAVCLQIVGRPCRDEELIAVTQAVDKICNGTPAST